MLFYINTTKWQKYVKDVSEITGDSVLTSNQNSSINFFHDIQVNNSNINF